jgi:predicted phosphoribosyltransferase
MALTDFSDRSEAGQKLVPKLKKYDDAIIFALPRGGVEVAREVALGLDAPLNLVIARKIGHPSWEEYAIGAVTETGPAIWNEVETANLNSTWLKEAEERERTEARRRREKYLNDHKSAPIADKTVILIDDGIATGLTIQAAVREINKQQPAKVIVAVPVAPAEAAEDLIGAVDEVITLIDPYKFRGAIGAHYDSFPQLSDEDVVDLLSNL